MATASVRLAQAPGELTSAVVRTLAYGRALLRSRREAKHRLLDAAAFARVKSTRLAAWIKMRGVARASSLVQPAGGEDPQAVMKRMVALEEVNQRKDEWIALANHDLKAPIASIKGYAQLLGKRVRSPAPDLEQVANGLDQIDRQATAMGHLLDDLLDPSLFWTGAFGLRLGPCDLNACLQAVLARLSPDERNRVSVRLPGTPVSGRWDRMRIQQVLANLVGNALKYSPAAERVSVVVGLSPGGIAVAVADRGMGIPPEEMPQLFEPYYRTAGAQASGLPGTGLGLYECRAIVNAHGGRIWAGSAGEHQGTTIRFTLPLVAPVPGSTDLRRHGGP